MSRIKHFFFQVALEERTEYLRATQTQKNGKLFFIFVRLVRDQMIGKIVSSACSQAIHITRFACD